MFEIRIKVDNNTISGFETLEVSSSIHSLCGGFSFSMIDFPVDIMEYIKPPSEVVIDMYDQGVSHKLLTGYIDRCSRSKGGGFSSLSFSGRSKTCDLVDCSALYKNNTWKKKKESQIMADICAQFNISVLSYVADENVELFTIQSGETCFGAMERIAKAYSRLLLTDGDGNLIVTNIGNEKAEVRLEVGQNVLEISYDEDFSDRYSSYYAKGQGHGGGSGWTNDIISLAGVADDEDIAAYRNRPLVFIVEKKATKKEIQQRANWEAQTRAGNSISCDVMVDGWLQNPDNSSSKPWAVNQLVNVVDKQWGIDSEFVISDVTFALNNTEGRVTKLKLNPPEIYKGAPGEKVELAKRSYVRSSA